MLLNLSNARTVTLAQSSPCLFKVSVTNCQVLVHYHTYHSPNAPMDMILIGAPYVKYLYAKHLTYSPKRLPLILIEKITYFNYTRPFSRASVTAGAQENLSKSYYIPSPEALA